MHLKWILFQMYLDDHRNISANDTYVDPESFVRGVPIPFPPPPFGSAHVTETVVAILPQYIVRSLHFVMSLPIYNQYNTKLHKILKLSGYRLRPVCSPPWQGRLNTLG